MFNLACQSVDKEYCVELVMSSEGEKDEWSGTRALYFPI